ncbi:MAG: integration host factor subunit alpha [Alphaproteobacteria bacterium]|jgi:integration host factor subunit alpha|nr:integration host factor subunit alpha [Alphaproteobacteria bacterium]
MTALTRADISNAIHLELGLSRDECAQFVDLIIDEILNAMENGETVKIAKFGSFYLRDKNERIGRNPKTGDEVPITPRRVITFRASQHLKKLVEQQTGG